MCPGAVCAQVASLRTGLGTSTGECLGRVQKLEEGLGGVRAQLAELAAAQAKASARSGSDVTFADLTLVKSQVRLARHTDRSGWRPFGRPRCLAAAGRMCR